MAESSDKSCQQFALLNRPAVAPAEVSLGEEITDVLAQCNCEAGGRFIIGAGCEVTHDTPLENFRVLVDCAANTTAD